MKKLRILVFGAGIIGCELAHELCQGNNDVTILARGNWKKTIAQNGLKILHYGQLRTTCDYIRTIETLEKDDHYDLIFVVMQYNQVMEIIPQLAENTSHSLVLVGNNMNPSYCKEQIQSLATTEKNIAFGFQGTGGRREAERVISMHFKVSMTLGGLREPLSADFEQLITNAFYGSSYHLDLESHMEGWLFSHAAHILPTAYLCYILNGNLKHASKKQIHMAVTAVCEAHQMLTQLGYPIRPDGEAESYSKSKKKKLRAMYFMLKSPAGKFVISTHCLNAIGEMLLLSNSFEQLRHQSTIPMPAWESLQKEALSSQILTSCKKPHN